MRQRRSPIAPAANRPACGLVDRLRAAIGVEVGMNVRGLGSVTGRVAEVGALDRLLVAESAGRDLLLRHASILGVTGLGLESAEPGSEGRVAERLDLRSLSARSPEIGRPLPSCW